MPIPVLAGFSPAIFPRHREHKGAIRYTSPPPDESAPQVSMSITQEMRPVLASAIFLRTSDFARLSVTGQTRQRVQLDRAVSAAASALVSKKSASNAATSFRWR